MKLSSDITNVWGITIATGIGGASMEEVDVFLLFKTIIMRYDRR